MSNSQIFRCVWFNYLTILFALTVCCLAGDAKPPNIIILYADDMGYGDLSIKNPDATSGQTRQHGHTLHGCSQFLGHLRVYYIVRQV